MEGIDTRILHNKGLRSTPLLATYRPLCLSFIIMAITYLFVPLFLGLYVRFIAGKEWIVALWIRSFIDRWINSSSG